VKGATTLRLVSNDSIPAFGSEYNFDDWVADLRGIVWHVFNRGQMTMEDIAVKADVCLSTVENFMYLETRRPIARTTFGLARAVGFRISFIPDNAEKHPAERDYREFRSLAKPRPKKVRVKSKTKPKSRK
jgi:hypothetical protein